ncbi:hypothetical protein D3C72_2189000 [compost metagenome]
MCLDQYLPVSVHTPCPATHLFHELEGSFIHPEVGITQQAVGTQDAHQGYVFKVQAFYHHLGAHQNINLTGRKIFDQL